MKHQGEVFIEILIRWALWRGRSFEEGSGLNRMSFKNGRRVEREWCVQYMAMIWWVKTETIPHWASCTWCFNSIRKGVVFQWSRITNNDI